MYNIKNNYSYSGYLIGGFIFLFISLILSTVFFFIFYSVDVFYNNSADVYDYEWHRVDEDSYEARVEYEYDDEIIVCRPNVTSSDKFEIDKVYFNDDNPRSCMIDLKESVGKFIYLIISIPATLVLIALILIIKGFSKKKKYNLLKQNGILAKNIPCTVTNLNTQVNGRYYVRIEATYTFPDGTTKKLRQMVLVDRKKRKDNLNTCDLLYLLEDYNVYCLDFNIEYQSYIM